MENNQYTVREMMDKYSITERTFFNWVKKGLVKKVEEPNGRVFYMLVEQ